MKWATQRSTGSCHAAAQDGRSRGSFGSRKSWKQEVDLKPCLIDGCRLDMRSVHDEKMIVQKPWAVMTTSSAFFRDMGKKTCCGGHDHAIVRGGQQTAASAYYPIKMARSVIRTFAAENEERDIN